MPESTAEIQTTTPATSEPRLYAGKYKTVEELEEGYKQSYPVHQENETLKKKLQTLEKAPDVYLTPEGLHLDENSVNEMKEVARKANLSQDAFNNLAR